MADSAPERTDTALDPGALRTAAHSHVSLEGVHHTIAVPHSDAGFWQKWRAFVGPAILVSVGYMDPGNWGTDLQAGAQFKYNLLWVVGLASLMAIFMQVISARLGVVTGKDLAQCCREWYPSWTRWPNWLFSEIAVAACDLAEVLGSAVALNLLFHIPLFWAVVLTGLDVLLLLALQSFGMRTIEAVVLLLIGTIAVCYFIEIFVLPETQPSFMEMARALVSPHLREAGMLYLAIGIIGATVMPHNLYLHSALVQSRQLQQDEPSMRSAVRFNTIDSVVALTIAFFVNSAILVLAATVFFGKESDLLEAIEASIEGRVSEGDFRWSSDPAVCVVMASGGYPGAFEAGKLITGIEDADRMYGVKVFHAGTNRRDGQYYTSGGRVLGVTARGSDLPEAVERAYDAVMKKRFDGMQYRKDIAARGLKHLREKK